MSDEKLCRKCKTYKPHGEFSPRPTTQSKDGLYSWCKTCMKKTTAEYRKKTPVTGTSTEQVRQWRRDHPDADSKQRRKRYAAYRDEALSAYGGLDPTCSCCGENTREFLALDHIEGGGNNHRKETGRGFAFFLWLRKNGYPPLFRILCHNCNSSMGYYGYCPHKAAFVPSPES